MFEYDQQSLDRPYPFYHDHHCPLFQCTVGHQFPINWKSPSACAITDVYLLNCSKDRHENIRVVVGALILNDRGQTFETHAGVHMFCWQFSQSSVLFTRSNEDVHVRGWELEEDDVTYRLNWMNTKFQISRTSGSSWLTRWAALRPPIRSKWTSVHGPHGPVSPISQKLSFMFPGRIWSSGKLNRFTITIERATIGCITISAKDSSFRNPDRDYSSDCLRNRWHTNGSDPSWRL